MKRHDQSLPKEDTSDLVKFKRLAMRVVSIPKDAIFDLDDETKAHKETGQAQTTKRKLAKPRHP